MTIPPPVITTLVEVLADAYTWAKLDMAFSGAGFPGDAPDGSSKAARCLAWFRVLNRETPQDALVVVGRLLHAFMEETIPLEGYRWPGSGGQSAIELRAGQRERVEKALAGSGLAYAKGGHIVRTGQHVAARQLADLIRGKDLAAIEAEFDTLAQRASAGPRDALSAAANIVEAVLGEMVSAWGLTPPANRTLNTLWAVVKPAINADPATMPDPELKKIVGAMAAMVDGLQGLRDDKSRAHAMRPELAKSYRIEARHARLAINAALALVVFLLEAWAARDDRHRSAG